MPPAQDQKTLFLYSSRNKLHKAIVSDLLSLTTYNIREKCKDLKEAMEMIEMWEVQMAVMFISEKERGFKVDKLSKNNSLGTQAISYDTNKNSKIHNHDSHLKDSNKHKVTDGSVSKSTINNALVNQDSLNGVKNSTNMQSKHKKDHVIKEYILFYHNNKTYKFLITNLVPIFGIFSMANCEKRSNNLVICDGIDELKPLFQFIFENGNCYEKTDDMAPGLKYQNIRKTIFITKKDENIELRVYVINQTDDKQLLKELGPRITCRFIDQLDGPLDNRLKKAITPASFDTPNNEKVTKEMIKE